MNSLRNWLVASAMAALAGTAQSALVSLGDGTVKDTNTNLIWLQNWSMTGANNWTTQMAWAESLDFAGSSEWVLPSRVDYLGLYSGYGLLMTQMPEFINVQSADYWSSTESPTGPDRAYVYPTNDGITYRPSKTSAAYAVAVRLGEATTVVPEPQTLALVLLALSVTAVAGRRRSS